MMSSNTYVPKNVLLNRQSMQSMQNANLEKATGEHCHIHCLNDSNTNFGQSPGRMHSQHNIHKDWIRYLVHILV